MARLAFWIFSAVVAAAAMRMGQAAIIESLEAQAIEPKPAGVDTPLQFGVAFQDIRFPVADHLIHGRFVAAAQPGATAILIFHGNGETVSDWSKVQARLHDAGLSSMVFDYGGFGNSAGKPTVDHMREDALAAYASLVRLTPDAQRRVLVGHSLGNAVMLDAAASLLPAPSGIVVHAGFTSAREMAVQSGLVSPLLSHLLPDLWDNEQALEAIGPPLLVLHGERDDVIPAAMGRRLAAAAGPRSVFMALAGVGHDEFYLSPSNQEWDPVIEFATSVTAAGRLASARP